MTSSILPCGHLQDASITPLGPGVATWALRCQSSASSGLPTPFITGQGGCPRGAALLNFLKSIWYLEPLPE